MAEMGPRDDVDFQQYIFRCLDVELANEIRRHLRDLGDRVRIFTYTQTRRHADTQTHPHSLCFLSLLSLQGDRVSLAFDDPGNPDHGVFTLGDDRYDVYCRNLPTVVESHKTLNDIDLVKTGNIGQILIVTGKVNEQAEPATGEYRDGLTPAMRSARQRYFHRDPEADPRVVAQVEMDMTRILQGGVPTACDRIIDVEEEWDEEREEWVPAVTMAKRRRQQQRDAAAAAAMGGDLPQGHERGVHLPQAPQKGGVAKQNDNFDIGDILAGAVAELDGGQGDPPKK